MRSWLLLGAVLPFTSAVRIVQSNDDGWAEANIRALFNNLVADDHEVVLSGPAQQKSGTGSSDEPPTKLNGDGCVHQSCPAGSPATGSNATDPRLNYVNSFPVTSIKVGIDTTAPKLWNGAKPELALTGPNVGSNIGIQVPFSGTVGAATYAVKEAKIPAIAFSGLSGDRTPWNVPVPIESKVYADLALNLTNTVIQSGKPYLPDNVWLNVNFGKVSEDECNKASDFKWILTRINSGLLSGRDTEWCGSTRLPWEADVIGLRSGIAGGCYATISIGDADDKTTIDAARQKETLPKFQSLLSCL